MSGPIVRCGGLWFGTPVKGKNTMWHDMICPIVLTSHPRTRIPSRPHLGSVVSQENFYIATVISSLPLLFEGRLDPYVARPLARYEEQGNSINFHSSSSS
ncbi:hypothetical protein Tco_1393581 [Tanacetum coccineum]